MKTNQHTQSARQSGVSIESVSSPASRDGMGEDWTRLPKPRGRFFGIARTTLLEMGERGEIKIALVRKRGATRGIRLIFVPSLRAALEKLAATEGAK